MINKKNVGKAKIIDSIIEGIGIKNPLKRNKNGGVDIDVLPTGKKRNKGSILIAETKAMERNRRLMEQQGERRLASVKAREHSNEEQIQNGPEGEMQNTILQHPNLDNPRFDGVDVNLNPEPPLNSDARKEFDNERREQEKEKQLRLGNMPKFSTAPKPMGP